MAQLGAAKSITRCGGRLQEGQRLMSFRISSSWAHNLGEPAVKPTATATAAARVGRGEYDLVCNLFAIDDPPRVSCKGVETMPLVVVVRCGGVYTPSWRGRLEWLRRELQPGE